MKTNKPSQTAMLVANGMYYNLQHKSIGAEVPQEIKELYTELNEYYYGNSWLNKQLLLIKAFFLQFFSVPGLYLHFLLRKKCIHSKIINLIEQVFEQVISLGAGYDILCTRLASKYPDLNFIELDHPASTNYTTSLFTDLGWKQPNISYISHDLTSRESPFAKANINKSLKTVIVCEGVLMYFEEKCINNIFKMLKEEFDNCVFVFTFMEEQSKGNYMFQNAVSFMEY